MSDNKKNHADELDQFWDISRLIPPKKQQNSHPTSAKKEICPQHISCPPIKETTQTERQSSPSLQIPNASATKEKTVFKSYQDFSLFIKSVKILNWTSSYNYYETFCRQAMALYNREGTACEEVHFFSYVAQYSQLNRGQLAWYLWWRECVRKGTYLKTDISYIYLLIFEIINLGSAIDTKKSLNILLSLWFHYSKTYPQLKSSLGDWICDYALIHKLEIPFPNPHVDYDMILSCSIPEVFLHFDGSNIELLSKFLLFFGSSYQYRKSKFYTEENRKIYDKYLILALEDLLEKHDFKSYFDQSKARHLSKVSFTGALCSYKTRKHIEIDYLSLSDSHEIKAMIGDIIKYAENKIRAHLGIRSRLSIKALNSNIKEQLDCFFSKTLAVSATNHEKIPEYERLYDVQKNEFSLADALYIEEKSWEVTQKLVDAFEEEATSTEPLPSEEANIPTTIPSGDSTTEIFYSNIAPYQTFFDFILHLDFSGQKAYLKQNHLMAEAVIDKINEAAFDAFGDILVEETDNGFRIIEEYRSMFSEEEALS